MVTILQNNKIIRILRLSKQAFGGYKLQIAILTILGFISGLLEGIGINALIPLFAFITGNADTGSDFISQTIEKLFLFFHINFSLKYLLIFISLSFVLKAVALILFSYVNIKIITDYEEKTRNKLLQKTLQADWLYLLKQKLGHLETTLVIDIANSATLLKQIGLIIMVLTSLLMYTLVAFNISLVITSATLVLGGILFLFFKPFIYQTKITAQRLVGLNRQIAHYVNENITGLKTIKSIRAEDTVVKMGREYFNKLKKIRVKIFLLKEITSNLLQPISLIFVCVIFAFSYKLFNFNFASLLTVIYLTQKVFFYFQQLQINLHKASEMVPFARSVLDQEAKIKEHKEITSGSASFKFYNVLEFRGVNFSYNIERDILSDVSFSIKKGEMLGLIGPSGAGKTTVVDLILRLLTPTNGAILLDEQNIQQIKIEEWRKNIGYVSQDIFLMNDTIANNIRFYDTSITDGDIKKAVKMANIDEFIQNCPEKFNTIVGERGVQLSAGQRQRIVIARVLARQPKILILDEATSALDNESEVKIQQVIKNLKGKITVLVVAHRLSTIINADTLLALDKGKIVETGRPQELLQDTKSYFYRVYNV